jgi:phosphoribosylamine--glycine ligase
MNILLLGSGGREHTFAWKMKQSPLCDELFIAPGNAGTAQLGTNLNLNLTHFESIKSAIVNHQIEMVVVGPEAPLVAGIYDFIRNDEMLDDVMVIGPSKAGAILEGSKAFSKAFMAEYNIPTAAYQKFTLETLEEGCDFIDAQTLPIVLKADGLAAGKGVLIIQDKEEAKVAFKEMLAGKFGTASKTVVIEQFLEGIEFSVFALTDGKNYKILPVAKDYKRIGEGDTGLNTGGMGCVSPVPFVDDALMKKVEERIIQPTIHGIQARKMVYHGFVFFGLINVKGEPYVIEYNCRMGDPETEVVFPRLKNDLVELMASLSKGNLTEYNIDIDERFATTVFVVSGGYPEKYEKGKPISNLDKIENAIVFHAGTREENTATLTNGGRVMAFTGLADTMQAALEISNHNANIVDFEGKYFRTDIGFDLDN